MVGFLVPTGGAVLAFVLWRARQRKRRTAKRAIGDEAVETVQDLVLDAFESIAAHPKWDPEHSCVILSGGLDTSIVAEVGGDVLGLKHAFTVLTTPEATDRPWAAAVAARTGMSHTVLEISLEEVLAELPWVVRALKTFDPMTLRNDIAVARALKAAAAQGMTCAVTGDAADEIYGGYAFTHRMAPEKWKEHQKHMAKVMKFDGVELGASLGIFVTSPYTQRPVVKHALTLPQSTCIDACEGVQVWPGVDLPDSQSLGKMPLRRAFPEVTAAMRRKDPIEVGCGTTALGARPWENAKGYFDSKMSDPEFEAEVAKIVSMHGVEIRDKEHLMYYRVFREVFPNGLVPGLPRHGSDPCHKCGYQMSDRMQTFCVTCGHYDANMRKKR